MRRLLHWTALGFVLALQPFGIVLRAQDESPTRSDPKESEWRKAFQEVRDGLSAVESCRARLHDYCSWEWAKSREESEVRAYREYLDARTRGEDVPDPLEGKVYLPDECRRLFATYPGGLTPRVARDAADSCKSRVAALIDGIERVEAHWQDREKDLEREARLASIPHNWRE